MKGLVRSYGQYKEIGNSLCGLGVGRAHRKYCKSSPFTHTNIQKQEEIINKVTCLKCCVGGLKLQLKLQLEILRFLEEKHNATLCFLPMI